MNKVLGFVFLSMVLGSCYYDKEETLYPDEFIKDTAQTTYSGVIKPLIAGNCAISGCHVPGFQVPDLSTYAGLHANIERVRIRAIELQTMPAAGAMSTANIAKLKKWIENGAQNN